LSNCLKFCALKMTAVLYFHRAQLLQSKILTLWLCWILQVVILVEWDCFCLFFHFSSSVHCCIEDILGFRYVSGRHFKVSLVWLLHVYFWTASLYRNLPSPFPRVFCLYVLELVLIWFRIHDCAVKGSLILCWNADTQMLD